MKNKFTLATRIKKASSDRRAAQKVELRLAILEVAVRLFETLGYEKFSLRQVAEAEGYTPTTIYFHFKNKDDLLLQAAMEGFRTFSDKLQEAYDGSDGSLFRFKEIGRAFIKFRLEHPVHYRLLFMQRGEFLSHEPPEGYESIVDSFGVLQRALMDCMEAGLIECDDIETHANTARAFGHAIVALNTCVPSVEASKFEKIQIRFEQSMREGFL